MIAASLYFIFALVGQRTLLKSGTLLVIKQAGTAGYPAARRPLFVLSMSHQGNQQKYRSACVQDGGGTTAALSRLRVRRCGEWESRTAGAASTSHDGCSWCAVSWSGLGILSLAPRLKAQSDIGMHCRGGWFQMGKVWKRKHSVNQPADPWERVRCVIAPPAFYRTVISLFYNILVTS